MIPLFLFVSATGFIVANSIAGALRVFPARAGAVSALIGAIQYGTGILGSSLVGVLADGTPWPMGAVIAVMVIGSLMCARFSMTLSSLESVDTSPLAASEAGHEIEEADCFRGQRLARPGSDPQRALCPEIS